MALKSDVYLRTMAETALQRAEVVEPPVAIEAVLERLGIPVRPVSLPRFFKAATVYEDGMPAMIVNWAHSEIVRRDALAHMLGHILLVLDDTQESFPRNAKDHREADVLATELVLPAYLVKEQSRVWFNDHRYLARLFGVDERRMLDRMTDLGIIRAGQSVRWDF